MKKIFLVLVCSSSAIFASKKPTSKQKPIVVKISEDENQLLQAAYNHDLNKVKELLSKEGVNVNVVSVGFEKRTPLSNFLATPEDKDKNGLKIVKELLDHGSNMNAREWDGSTPLHHTIIQNNLEAGRLLIEKGANIDLANYSEETPLMKAVKDNKIDFVKLLLENKAQVNLKNKSGKTALDLASGPEIRNMLKNAGAKTSKQLKKEEEDDKLSTSFSSSTSSSSSQSSSSSK